MRAATIVLLISLTACTPNKDAPQVIARSPGNIVILTGASSHIQETMTTAQVECGRQGPRNAVQRSATLIGGPITGQVRFTFECVRE